MLYPTFTLLFPERETAAQHAAAAAAPADEKKAPEPEPEEEEEDMGFDLFD